MKIVASEEFKCHHLHDSCSNERFLYGWYRPLHASQAVP